MTLIDGADFFVYLIDLPPAVGGCCTPNSDGTYTVYLNSRLDRDHNIDSYIHEYEHMDNDDFNSATPIRAIEQ